MSTKKFIKNNKRWFSALALTIMVGASTLAFGFKGDENKVETKKLVNPQWFTYNLDPTLSTFNTDKLNPDNYTATSITDPVSAPCSGDNDFCSIYAETVSGKPNLNVGQPIRSQLNAYTNRSGETSILHQQANP
jgi:hypothetical protein